MTPTGAPVFDPKTIQKRPDAPATPSDLDRALHDWQTRFTSGRSPSSVPLAMLICRGGA
jgi:hypothetical protein